MQSLFLLAQEAVLFNNNHHHHESATSEGDTDGPGGGAERSWISFEPRPITAVKSQYRGAVTPARKAALDQTWSTLERAFDKVLAKANGGLFQQVRSFVEQLEHDHNAIFDESKPPQEHSSDDDENEDESESEESSDGMSVQSEAPAIQPEQLLRSKRDRLSEFDPPPAATVKPKLKKRKQTTKGKGKRRKKLDSSDSSSSSDDDYSSESNEAEDENDQKGNENNKEHHDDENDITIRDFEAEIAALRSIEADATFEEEVHLTSTPLSYSTATPKLNFLPVALVIGGQDVSDNQLLLGQLASKLVRPKRRVIRLQSGMAKTPKALTEVLMQCVTKKRYGIGNPTDRLVRWAQQQACAPISTTSAPRIQSLVVVVDDFESFEAPCIRRLVHVLAMLRRESDLPMALIVGVSGVASEGGLTRMLERDEIRLLRVNVFRPKSSLSIFEHLFERLFVENPSQLDFGRSTLQWFDERFHLEELSLSSFKQQLKYCLLRHFARERASFLCVSPRHGKSSRTPLAWAEEVVDMRFVGGKTSIISYEDIKFTKLTRDEMVTILTLKETLRRNRPAVVRFFREVARKLQLVVETDLIARNLLTMDWTTTQRGEALRKKLLLCSQETLEEIKALAVEILPESLHGKVEKVFSTRSSASEGSTPSPMKQLDIRKMGAEKRRQVMLQQALKGKASSSAGSRTVSRAMVDEIAKFVEDLFLTYISPNKAALQEFAQAASAFYTDRSDALDRAFCLNQSDIVFNGLTRPNYFYLSCECCKDDELAGTMDDVVIAFQVLRDCTKDEAGYWCTLRTWYDSFRHAIEGENILERFVRAACELSYVGVWREEANETVRLLVDCL